MKFHYRLERLLSIVRIRENMKKLEMGAVVRKVEMLRRRQNELQASIRHQLQEGTGSSELDLAMMVFRAKKIQMDREEEVRLEGQLAEEESGLSKLRDELNRMSLRRRGLESLREKRHAEFKLEESRRVQKQLDEAYQLSRKES